LLLCLPPVCVVLRARFYPAHSATFRFRLMLSAPSVTHARAGKDTTPGYLKTVYAPSLSTDVSVGPGIKYYWWVEAVNSCDSTDSQTKPASFCMEPLKADGEYPADEAQGVSLAQTLHWTPGAGTAASGGDNVYFGTSQTAVSNATTSSDEYMGRQDSNSYDPGTLGSNTTYYWRIDQNSAYGCVCKGDVWWFETCSLPGQAGSESPQNYSSGASLDANLSWSAGALATSHDVYTGTDEAELEFKGNQAQTVYEPGALEPNTTYWWRINEKNGCGTTAGTIWSFTTCSLPGEPTDPYPDANGSGVALGVSLSWRAGDGAQQQNGHDVYFGTSYADVNEAGTDDADIYMGSQDNNSWDTANYDSNGLYSNTVYYWRIDEKNDCGKTKGPVVHFTTCVAPMSAACSYPEPNLIDVPLDASLCWTPGGGAAVHDVYLGTDFNSVSNAAAPNSPPGRGSFDSNSYEPQQGLDSNTVYYWRIDEKNDCCITKGVVWQFSTCAVPGKAAGPAAIGAGGEPNAVDSTVTWQAGDLAEQHIIYFGVDANEVAEANMSSDEFIGIGDVNSFDTRRVSGFLLSEGKLRGVGSPARTAEPNVIHVDWKATGAGNGSSWADAYTGLEDAFSDANVSGKDIWVAEGIYKPTDGNDRTVAFDLVAGVGVYGGFSGVETELSQRDWRKFETVLSGDINSIGDYADNCYHVATADGVDANTVLDGFTITAGNADGAPNYNSGGGMLNWAASPTVINCTFYANRGSYGGAIANRAVSSPSISGCVFHKNKAVGGGGIHSAGGACQVSRCLFYQNEATNYGGGIGHYGCDIGLTNCVFAENVSSGSSGGGAIFGHLESTPEITNCTFVGNLASLSRGGAIMNYSGTTPVIGNCIFWANDANEGGGEIYNMYDSADPNFRYCDIEGGINGSKCGGFDSVDGGGNIDSDPCIVDAGLPCGSDAAFGTSDDGFRLAAGSGCIDAGDTQTDSDDVGVWDAAGRGRFVDGDSNDTEVIDIGAYEYDPNYVESAEYNRPAQTEALGLNETGTIVGVFREPNGRSHAFVRIVSEGNDPYPWVSQFADLHPAGDANESTAYDISDSNWIVGNVGEAAFVMKYPDDTNMLALPSLYSESDRESVACAVTDRVGGSGAAAVGWSGGRAVLWDDLDSNEPTLHNLGAVQKYHKSKALAVNAYGQVVGLYWPAFGADRRERAFAGSVEQGLSDIGTMAQGGISRAYGINRVGQVVGQASIDANDTKLRAFIYDSGGMRNLDELILRDPNEPNWTVLSARSINDEGFIAACGNSQSSGSAAAGVRALVLIPARPVGHWQFDEGCGSSTMDSSMSGNHGSLAGPTWAGGKIRGCLDFGGSGGVYLETSAGSDSVLNIYNSDVTLAAWVKYRGSGGTVAARAKPGHTAYRLGVAAGKAYINTCRNENWTAYTDEIVGLGVWHHIVGVFDRRSHRGRVYVDGLKKADEPLTAQAVSNDAATKIGCCCDSTDDAFDGLIDDVRIYPWALSDTEVKELFDGQSF